MLGYVLDMEQKNKMCLRGRQTVSRRKNVKDDERIISTTKEERHMDLVDFRNYPSYHIFQSCLLHERDIQPSLKLLWFLFWVVPINLYELFSQGGGVH